MPDEHGIPLWARQAGEVGSDRLIFVAGLQDLHSDADSVWHHSKSLNTSVF